MLRLKQLRTENNMSQRALAKKINVSQKGNRPLGKRDNRAEVKYYNSAFKRIRVQCGLSFGTRRRLRHGQRYARFVGRRKTDFIRLFKTRQKATGRA